MDTTSRLQRLKQKIYIVTPLFLLVLCLGLINFGPGWMERRDMEGQEIELVTEPTTISDGRAAVTAVPTPVPSPTTSPSSTPYPTLPPEAIIALLGPPQDGRFRETDTISFYWDWHTPLREDKRLAVYARKDGQDTLLGILDEPNLGQSYRIQIDAQAITSTSAEIHSIQWFVRLQSTAQPQLILLESEIRMLTIAP